MHNVPGFHAAKSELDLGLDWHWLEHSLPSPLFENMILENKGGDESSDVKTVLIRLVETRDDLIHWISRTSRTNCSSWSWRMEIIQVEPHHITLEIEIFKHLRAGALEYSQEGQKFKNPDPDKNMELSK